jgi:LPXTG-site transpeptidase (sortase) family protein
MNASGTIYLNNHLSDSLVSFSVAPSTSSANTLPATGFAPNRVTVLAPQSVVYADQGDLWLEIPRLELKTAIVGVPQSSDGSTWDVSWLGNKAGWLNGTTFPTWKGNSIITGHVWDASNTPGIFVNLKQLAYGDQVKVHYGGQVYTYEVRQSSLVSPSSTGTALKHEEQSWITLLTCEDYNFIYSNYPFRRIVRAVLLSVTDEK